MECSDNEMKQESMAENLSEKELLANIWQENKKRTFYARLAAFSAVGAFALVVLCLLLVVPQVFQTVDSVNDALAVAEATLAEAENAAAGLAKMSDNVTVVSENLNDFVTENAAAMSEAMKDIGSIDYQGLNKAIRDLQAAVEPFANFMNRFK